MAQFSHLYSSALDHELANADSTQLFTTGRRQSAINEGMRKFADLTECFTRQSTITCSNAVGEYNLLASTNVPGGDFLRLAKQAPEFHRTSSGGVTTYISGPNLERRDPDWLNRFENGWRSSTGGTPRFYYERMDGGQRLFGLYPAPTVGSSEHAQVLLPYVANPAEMTSDTDAPFSTGASTTARADLEPYHQGLVHYAAHKLEKLRANGQDSQTQLQAFLGYVESFLRSAKPKGGQTLKHLRSYFGEARRKRWQDFDGPTSYPW